MIKLSENIKKVLIISGILVVFIGIGASYFVWQKVNKLSQPSTSPETTKEEQSVSQHPWPQFHGTYFHTGYAKVKGPQKATLKWKLQLGAMAGGDPNSVAISSDGTIYVAGAARFFALDKNGKELWSKSYQGTQGPALAEDGTIYFLAQNTIVALDKNGNEKWKFKTNGNTGFGPTIGPDGTIYQGSWDGYFYALNQDGTLKWKYKTAGKVSYPASIDKNGTIYLGGGDAHAGLDSNLYAFNPDGSLKWKYDTKAMRVGSPAIGPDGLIYVAAAPSLFVLDSDGNLKWKKGPEISFHNIQVAYAAECGAPPLPACGGVQPSNGFVPDQSSGCGAPPLPPCSGMGQPQNGNMLAPLPSKDDIAGIITPAIASDGTIYIGNAQGILSAINSKTQEVKWTYQTGVDPNQPGFYGLPSFPLVDKEGTVYIGSVDGKMYAVSKEGKLLWSYQTGNKITESSPAFGSNGTLYFTSMDGYLYAIGD
jgi:outer membrane protein assembly factor BamB